MTSIPSPSSFEFPAAYWNAVYVHPDFPSYPPLHSLDNLLCHVDNFHVRFLSSGQPDPSDLMDIMGSTDFLPVVNVYDRDPSISDWYYTIYALKNQDHMSQPNSIVNALSRPGLSTFGPAFAVKNGPWDGDWVLDDGISSEAFGRSAWWYLRSGNTVDNVFGERGLLRFLKQ
ncbi:hypothetical protein DENSPDRAFT_788068 [Dentipellis sp. KUC8613]|nr:hypothetical protein DENSPDRAFT_788068 [Dentipellis sp. KUC8613]